MSSAGGIGGGSVLHIASSLARSIAGGESTSPAKTTETQQGLSIAESIKTAFDGLIKAQQTAPETSGVAGMEPFSPPDVPPDGLMGSLKDAVGAFRELAGGKQKWNIDALDAQRVSDLGGKQLGLAADAQKVSDLGGQQLGLASDAQRVSDLGSQQLGLVSDAQRVSDLGGQQLGLVSDAQRVSDLGSKQLGLVSDAQRVSDLGGKQLTSEFDKQRALQPGEDLQTSSSALKMLDHCNQLFGLLDQIVARDQDLVQKTNQMLR